MNSRNSSSPASSSPLAMIPRLTPQPISPLDLSLHTNANGGYLSDSHESWPSLFDNNPSIMSIQQGLTSVSIGSTSSSPYASSDSPSNISTSTIATSTTHEDGNEVGYYNAFANFNINPAYNDDDLFINATMVDAIGEDFVWIENLFEDILDTNDVNPTPEDTAAMSIIAAFGASTITPSDSLYAS
ncbi:hypothetical protein BGZ76_003864 [Entomortierella beljakovae]|nr:hypothetical protein BGZ76_003864 [Entomortierella beljakovae]